MRQGPGAESGTAEVLFAAASANHRAGRLAEASRGYAAVLKLQPDHVSALHLLGVLHHQNGDTGAGLPLVERAAERVMAGADVWSNLAELRRASGLKVEAEAAARRALELRPDYPEALLNLSVALFAQGRFEEAETAARRCLAARPDMALAHAALADSLREQWRLTEAVGAYREALGLKPDLWSAHGNLGLVLVRQGELEGGIEHCRKAAEAAGREASALKNLGLVLLEAEKVTEAMEALEPALNLAPNDADISVAIGRGWLAMGEFAEAETWLARAEALDPGLAEARLRRGELRLEAEDAQGALTLFEGVLEADADNVDALTGRARARLDLGDVEGAAKDYQKTIGLRPEAAYLRASLGHLLSTAGDLDAAVRHMRDAVRMDQNAVSAVAGILTTLRHKAEPSERDRALDLLGRPWITPARAAALHFGLAAHFDGARDTDAAAHHMVQANALAAQASEARGRAYSPAGYEALVDRLIDTFTPELFERAKDWGDASERPVFIVGMPRSGTTLTEQILASHPAVFGAGERKFASAGMRMVLSRGDSLTRDDVRAQALLHLERLKALDGGSAARIVDKMPDNYHALGWLALGFPKARFIYCRRDLRDVALSCWITNFSQLYWANDMAHIRHRMEQHLRLMDHWRQVAPAPLLEVDYEEMVADQEGVSRRLIDWVGLDWDDRCLAFHETERLVRTASVAQVREPIYRRSIARWEAYAGMLGPVCEMVTAGHISVVNDGSAH